jgi:hypothetical protein
MNYLQLRLGKNCDEGARRDQRDYFDCGGETASVKVLFLVRAGRMKSASQETEE